MSSLVSANPEIGKQPVLEKETRLELEQGIGYKFNNIDILANALRHRSWCAENDGNSNERLEFLGDAVLGLLVAKKCF
jgi:ribonuclease-3